MGNPYAGLDPADVTPPTPTPRKPKVAAPGWYRNPYRRGTEWYWNGASWEGYPRRAPDIEGLGPSGLTLVALFFALTATCLTIPFFIQSLSLSFLPGETHEGWQSGLWGVAFFVGLTSFVLALVSLGKERTRRSRSRRLYARLALAVAIIGCCVWSFSFLGVMNVAL